MKNFITSLLAVLAFCGSALGQSATNYDNIHKAINLDNNANIAVSGTPTGIGTLSSSAVGLAHLRLQNNLRVAGTTTLVGPVIMTGIVNSGTFASLTATNATIVTGTVTTLRAATTILSTLTATNATIVTGTTTTENVGVFQAGSGIVSALTATNATIITGTTTTDNVSTANVSNLNVSTAPAVTGTVAFTVTGTAGVPTFSGSSYVLIKVGGTNYWVTGLR